MEIQWLPIQLFIEQNELPILVCLLLVLTGFITMPISFGGGVGWWNYAPRKYRRGKAMHRKARRDYVFNLLTQDFVDSVEQRVYHAEITRSEATELYRSMKLVFPIRNLFPNPELLKEKIKNRLGKHIQPNFPDKKEKPKHAFEKRRVVM